MDALAQDTQAALLLLNRLGDPKIKPLSNAEYNRLARDLRKRSLRPGDLIRGGHEGYSLDAGRLGALLSRGAALAVTAERWAQAGIRVVGRGEAEYPMRIKGRLREDASPLIFYSGRLDLLDHDALCIVGSRDPTEEGLAFAEILGRACAKQGYAVVSGDARGVDRAAMWASLERDGRGVAVLAESLFKASLSRRNRDQILAGRLLMLSPYDPEARFTVSQAMNRNRYLYALSVAAVVVDSDVKGGTWSGAVENQEARWTPAYVRLGEGVQTGAGNAVLAKLGLKPISEDDLRSPLSELIQRGRIDLEGGHEPGLPFEGVKGPDLKREAGETGRGRSAAKQSPQAAALQICFMTNLVDWLGVGSQPASLVAERFGLEPVQVERWLQQATDDGRIQWTGGDIRLTT